MVFPFSPEELQRDVDEETWGPASQRHFLLDALIHLGGYTPQQELAVFGDLYDDERLERREAEMVRFEFELYCAACREVVSEGDGHVPSCTVDGCDECASQLCSDCLSARDDARARAVNHYYTCRHFDAERSLCRAYQIRPDVCRTYPGGGRCAYKSCGWGAAKVEGGTAEDGRVLPSACQSCPVETGDGVVDLVGMVKRRRAELVQLRDYAPLSRPGAPPVFVQERRAVRVAEGKLRGETVERDRDLVARVTAALKRGDLRPRPTAPDGTPLEPQSLSVPGLLGPGVDVDGYVLSDEAMLSAWDSLPEHWRRTNDEWLAEHARRCTHWVRVDGIAHDCLAHEDADGKWLLAVDRDGGGPMRVEGWLADEVTLLARACAGCCECTGPCDRLDCANRGCVESPSSQCDGAGRLPLSTSGGDES